MEKNFPFGDSEIAKLRKLYSVADDFKRKISRVRTNLKERKSNGSNGLRTNHVSDIWELSSYFREKGFSEEDLDLFKRFEKYAVSTYPGSASGKMDIRTYQLSQLFPESWFGKPKRKGRIFD